jgi:hypothetical protein
MATDRKHIAVYLAPEIEQALIEFCQEKGLISKKGTMFSAGVNTALAQFFGITDTSASNTLPEIGNIPQDTGNISATMGNIPQDTGNISATMGNILANTGNIPCESSSNIPTPFSNIPVESLAMEGLPGKFQT